MTSALAQQELRTVADQAQVWRCSNDAVLDAIRAGELRATKIAGRWLIDPADAIAYAEARTNRPSAPKRARRPRRRIA